MWQIKSLPIAGRDVLLAKLLLNFLLCFPVSLLVGAAAGIALGATGALEWIWLLLTPCAYTVFVALIGLMGNIRWHRYDWTNETTVVKQSAGAMLPVLASMFTTLPALYFVIVSGNPSGFMACITGIVLAADIVFGAFAHKKAERWYAGL